MHILQKIDHLARNLPPNDLKGVLEFYKAQLAFRKANLKPITPQEWERLPRYVRYACMCLFWWTCRRTNLQREEARR